MKLSDWAKQEDLQLEWKKAWEEIPALKAGLAVLVEAALPSEVKVPTGVDPIQFNALINSKREGYYDALRNIEALKEFKKPLEVLPDPWSEPNKGGL
jgi:hypothetical protein